MNVNYCERGLYLEQMDELVVLPRDVPKKVLIPLLG